MARYLLSQKKGLFLLSERLNQDPLESFFGQQRARGGRTDNPNVRSFLYNTQVFKGAWQLVMEEMSESGNFSGQLILMT